MYRFLGYGFCIGLYGAALYYTAEMFNFKIGKDGTPEFKAGELCERNKISISKQPFISAFDQKQLKEVLTWLVPLTMVYGFASLVLLVSRQIYEVTHQTLGFFSKAIALIKVLSYGIMIAALFANSLVIFLKRSLCPH